MDDQEDESFFGSSDIRQSAQFEEKRLDYRKPVYRDVWCAVIYYLVLATVVGVTIYIWVDKWPEIEEHNENIKNAAASSNAESWANNFDYTGFVVTLVLCAVIGLLFGFCWLQILRCMASFIIKIMLFLSIFLWIAITALAFYDNNTPLGVIAAIFTLVLIMYTWCIWGRIRFASVLLVSYPFLDPFVFSCIFY